MIYAIFIFQEDVSSIKGVDLQANIVDQSVQLLVSESDDPNDEEALRFAPSSISLQTLYCYIILLLLSLLFIVLPSVFSLLICFPSTRD